MTAQLGADLLYGGASEQPFCYFIWNIIILSLCGKGPNIGQVQSELEPGSPHFQD